MSDVDHGLRCHDARLANLKLFWMSRGHSADEAHDYATRHLQGENVPINEPPDPAVQQAQPVLDTGQDSGSESAIPDAT